MSATAATATLITVGKWAVGVIATWAITQGLDYVAENIDTDWLKPNKPQIKVEENTNKQEENKPKEDRIGPQGNLKGDTTFTEWLNSQEGQEFLRVQEGIYGQGSLEGDKTFNDWVTSQEGKDWIKQWENQAEFPPVIEPPKQEEPVIPPTEQTPTIEPSIKDETNLNLEGNIGWLDQIEKWRNEQWEREDQIRKETQEREDSAYQRAVKDMQKAGINPNLMNVNPASSGGGITQATGVDTSVLTNQMNIDLDKMQQIIDNAFKEDENAKDRFMDVFGEILKTFGIWILTKGAIKR